MSLHSNPVECVHRCPWYAVVVVCHRCISSTGSRYGGVLLSLEPCHEALFYTSSPDHGCARGMDGLSAQAGASSAIINAKSSIVVLPAGRINEQSGGQELRRVRLRSGACRLLHAPQRSDQGVSERVASDLVEPVLLVLALLGSKRHLL